MCWLLHPEVVAPGCARPPPHTPRPLCPVCRHVTYTRVWTHTGDTPGQAEQRELEAAQVLRWPFPRGPGGDGHGQERPGWSPSAARRRGRSPGTGCPKTNPPVLKAESVSSATLGSDVGGDQPRRSEGWGSRVTLIPAELRAASAPSLSGLFP